MCWPRNGGQAPHRNALNTTVEYMLVVSGFCSTSAAARCVSAVTDPLHTHCLARVTHTWFTEHRGRVSIHEEFRRTRSAFSWLPCSDRLTIKRAPYKVSPCFEVAFLYVFVQHSVNTVHCPVGSMLDFLKERFSVELT